MNPQDDIAMGKGAADEAVRWFVRLQDEAAGFEEWRAFEAWLAASPANAEAYHRLEGLWSELDDLAADLRPALEATGAKAGPRRDRRAPPTATRRRWIAASAAAAASLGAVLLLRPDVESPTIAPTVYEAAPGQIRQVTLADGTSLRLNAGSRVSVRLDGGVRRVTMSDAEASFDVAHDGRPFLIRVGDSDVRVVGTEFNVRNRDGALVLTVRRGLVEVRPADQAQAAPIRLARGEQLVHEQASGRSSVANVDPDEAFDWTQNRLVYRDAPLSEVAADLGRRFGRPVRTADARTGATRFSGVLMLDEEPAVLRRLAGLAPVNVEQAPDGAVVLRRHD